MRYRMLEIIRQYATEKLEESGEAGEVQGRHAAFFLALAEEAEPELAGSQQGLWVERLEGEHDNLQGGALVGPRAGGRRTRAPVRRGALAVLVRPRLHQRRIGVAGERTCE